MVNFPYYLFSFDFLVADIYLGLQTVIHLLHLPIFAPILIIMLNQCMLLPQYKNSPPKAQIPAYFQKVVDIHNFVGIIIQQLRRKVCLRLEKRAAFLFRQQHHYFFSSIFADGTSGASVFTFTHRRCFAVLGMCVRYAKNPFL